MSLRPRSSGALGRRSTNAGCHREPELSSKVCDDLCWSFGDLFPGVPDDLEPQPPKDEFALAIPARLGPPPVRGGTVEFGDEPLLSPHCVDLHPADPRIDLG